jgi:hypothetical protein
MNVESLVADLEESVCFAQAGANIGGAPCGALYVIIRVYVIAAA